MAVGELNGNMEGVLWKDTVNFVWPIRHSADFVSSTIDSFKGNLGRE